MNRKLIGFCTLIISIIATCYGAQTTATFLYQPIDSNIESDPKLEAMLNHYRKGVEEYAAEVVCFASEPLPRARPESGIANHTADALRIIGTQYFEEPVDVAITNFGGLRRDLEKGPITMGLVTELSPFENYLVLIAVDGKALLNIASVIAHNGGMPISGMKIGIGENNQVANVLVNGKDIDPNHIYKIVTIDYLLAVNKKLFPTHAIIRKNKSSEIRQRDAIVDYFRSLHKQGTGLTDLREGRIFYLNSNVNAQ